MNNSIKISQKHGVNPSVMVCFFCGEDVGVALLGRMKDDRKAPHRGVFDKEPCNKCSDLMTQGVLLISVKDADEGKKDPYRTGGWCVVRDEVISRILDEEIAEVILRARMAYVPDTAWDMIGLPRDESAPATEEASDG